MKDLKKKVAYLQGLMAGMDLDPQSKETRLLREVVDVMEKMADAIHDLHEDYEELEEYLESIDEDLYDLEDEIYDEDDDEDEDEDDDEDFDDEDDEGDYIEVECPKCHEIVCFDADILDDEDVVEVTCPNCETVVFVNEDEEETSLEDGDNKGQKKPATEDPGKDTDDI